MIKNSEDIKGMRVAGKLAAQTLEMIGEHVKPGISTGELDKICHDFIVDEIDCIPAPLNYKVFQNRFAPQSIKWFVMAFQLKIEFKKQRHHKYRCHVIKDGYHGDTSKMFMVGKAQPHAQRLVDITQECLYRGIEQVKPGARLGDIGHAIQVHAEGNHYSVVREYCGHGIGKVFHEDPQVLHYGQPNTGMSLQEGMCFTIEPMINLGTYKTKLSKTDGWTVETADGRLSAQWEHTILVTQDGFEVLTQRSEESF
jgi:methionyl aminopeptidase